MGLGSVAVRDKCSLERSAKEGYAFNFTSLPHDSEPPQCLRWPQGEKFYSPT